MDESVQESVEVVKREAVMQVYKDLSADERARVDRVAEVIDDCIEEREPNVRFSHSMAVELVGKIGLLLAGTAD